MPEGLTCDWKEDLFGIWVGSCGFSWMFEGERTPADKGMKYCPGCGKVLRECGIVHREPFNQGQGDEDARR